MVASTGREIGSTILLKITNWLAPSIFADSTRDSGTVVLKNVLQTITLNEDTDSGNIKAHTVSFKPRNWLTMK